MGNPATFAAGKEDRFSILDQALPGGGQGISSGGWQMSEQAQAISATYLPEVECRVRPGDAEWEVIVTARDEKGRKQNLSVSKGLVSHSDGKDYLFVGIVQVDYPGKRVLIELPCEADSGVNRLWVPFTSFRKGA
jgi:hypothetical protein